MNKAYKVVYNESTGTYVAVSEIETSKGKSIQSQVDSAHAAPNKRPVKRLLTFTQFSLTLLGVFTSLAMPMAHASWFAGANGTGGAAYGSGSSTSIAIGSGTTAATKADAAGTNSIAIGSAANTTTTATNAISIGSQSTATQLNSIAIGTNAWTNKTNSGDQAEVNAIAIGSSADAYAYSVALGSNAYADGGQGGCVWCHCHRCQFQSQ